MPIQMNMFDFYKAMPVHFSVITDTNNLQLLRNVINQNNVISFDTETSGLRYWDKAKICGVSLAIKDNGIIYAWYVPVRHQTGEKQLSPEVVFPVIRELFENPDKLIIDHNSKFEEHMLRLEGISWKAKRYDTYIGARLYNENDSLGLKHRAVTDLGILGAEDLERTIEAEINRYAYGRKEEFRKNKKVKNEYLNKYGYSEIPINHCGHYACKDVELTYLLYEKYESTNLSKRIGRVWETEHALVPVICDMEENGVRIDRKYLNNLQKELLVKEENIESGIKTILGNDYFDLGSDPQLRDYVLKKMKLNLVKKTEKGQLAVDREALEPFAKDDKTGFINLYLDWRDTHKLLSTYTETILEYTDSNDILHGEVIQVGTNTGRMSSEHPNLQNNPKDSTIRRAFLTRNTNSTTIVPDYSQVELRVLAHYAQDRIMLEAFEKDEDLHSRTAAEVFNVSIAEVTKEQRQYAKAINFGLSYGMTEYGLSKKLKNTPEEAKVYLEKYFNRFFGVADFKQKFFNDIRRSHGVYSGLFGREYHVHRITSDNDYERSQAERTSFSRLVQGGAAELTKASLVRLDEFYKLHKIPAKLVNVIHDEIWIECDLNAIGYCMEQTKRIMEDFPEITVPIKVDISYFSDNWANKKKIEI